MRHIVLVSALIALSACTAEQKAPSAASPPAAPSAPAASAALPQGFPQSDPVAQAAECIVYLGLSREAKATPGGYDAVIMQQASDQWRASLRIDGKLSDQEATQLVASTVNPLAAAPADQRDAAAAWCVANAAEPDPSTPKP